MLRPWLNELTRRFFPPRRGRRPAPIVYSRARIELLEARVVPSTFTVLNSGDSGAGSLRQAILNANANLGADSIVFNIPTSDPGYNSGAGTWTITPLSALPTVTDPVILDATTQPGFAGTPVIVLSGASAGSGVTGLTITAGASTVKGLVINGFGGAGLDLTTGGGNLIEGNFIGTNAAGTAALGNANGVVIASTSNTVGGTTAGAGNLISGNGTNGVELDGNGNLVQGNFIGTNLAGNAGMGNQAGVLNTGAGNTVGGTTGTIGPLGSAAFAGNVIDANTYGVENNGGSLLIEGNYIGTDYTGMARVGNGFYGIYALSGNATIGGTAPGAGNLISGNNNDGVALYASNSLVQGNFIGTDVTGTHALGNTFEGIVFVNATNNTIGGTTAAARNIIAGNGETGIRIFATSSNNLLEGNYIGTDKTGTVALPNLNGGVLVFQQSTNNTIGGTTAGAGNVISGNSLFSIAISDSTATGNVVAGNLIGTDKTGTVALGNGGGVQILNGATNNTIGGTTAGAGNVISGSAGEGVDVTGSSNNLIAGNYIGTDITGTVVLGNTFYGLLLYQGAANNTVGGTTAGSANVISGNSDGIIISGAGTIDNLVAGNVIGLGADGSTLLGNRRFGILADVGANNNIIGGLTAPARNVIADNPTDEVLIQSATGNLVQGNYIGVRANGTAAPGSAYGVQVVSGSPNNLIGGTVAGAGNVISDNTTAGVSVDSTSPGNLIAGNLIGTDATGTIALANGTGILVASGNNTIGGTTAAARNVISGNTGQGVVITGSTATGNLIAGNYIGTNLSGTAALANSVGVQIDSGSTNNTVGGTAAAAGNVISGNTGAGVTVITGAGGNLIEGNYIGTNAAGTAAVANGGNGITEGGVREFPTPPPNSALDFMAAGPNGNAWFEDVGSGNLAQITPTGQVIPVPTPLPVGDFVFGPDGNIWFSGDFTSGENYIGEMTPSGTLLHDYPIASSAAPHISPTTTLYLTIGPDGNIWYTEPFITSDVIGRLTPSGQITEFSIPFDAGWITTGPDSNLWFTAAETNAVGRITPAGAVTIFTNPAPTPLRYQGIIAGPNGNLWMSTGIGNTIVELNTSGQAVAQFPASGSPYALVRGPDGNVWYNEQNANNIGRISPQGLVTEFPIPTPNSFAEGPIAGPDGNIWFAEDNTGQIGEVILNPTTAHVLANTIGGTVSGAGNVIAGNGGNGISLSIGGNLVAGNRIGTNAAGTAALANAKGVVIASANNTVGGTTAGAGNLISGNTTNGVELDGSGNLVQGNLIGTDAAGTAALGNGSYATVVNGSSAQNNLIGGTAPGAGNVLSASGLWGVYLNFANNNTVQGNYVGTDRSGSFALGNASGVVVVGSGNLIGGTAAVAGNLVSGNRNGGITVAASIPSIAAVNPGASANDTIQGNLVGLNAAGTATIPNGGWGIYVQGAQNVLIGGTAPGAGNIVAGTRPITIPPTTFEPAGSNGAGIIAIGPAPGLLVEGNRIGTDRTGTAALPNAGSGVFLLNSTATISGNQISGNGGDGITVCGNGVPNGWTGLWHADGTTFDGNDILGTLLGGAGYAPGLVDQAFSFDGVSGALQDNINSSFIPGRVQYNFGATLEAWVNTTAAGGTLISDGGGIDTQKGLGLFLQNGHLVALGSKGTAGQFNFSLTSPGTVNDGNWHHVAVTWDGTTTAGGVALYVDGVTVASGTALVTFGTYASSRMYFGGDPNLPLPYYRGLLDEVGVYSAALSAGDIGTIFALRGLAKTRLGSVVSGNLIGTNAAGTAALGNAGQGVNLVGSSFNTIGGTTAAARNVISGNSTNGVLISGSAATGNVVASNYIGIDITGTAALGNGPVGVLLNGGASNNTIGGTTAAARNVIDGGNSPTVAAVEITGPGASGNVLAGNYIGTNASGTSFGIALQQIGVFISAGASNNTIGGATAGAGNVIGSSNNCGIGISDSATSGTVVAGNFVGLGADNSTSVGNVWGIIVGNAAHTTIGGTTAAARNVVSDNLYGIDLDGVATVLEGNYIGTDATGTIAKPNGQGVLAQEASSTIGGLTATPGTGAGNVISGNGGSGLGLFSDPALVEGNIIGLNATGTAILGNGQDGIFAEHGPAGAIIGGTAAGARNVISGNGGNGINFSFVPGFLQPVNDTVQGNFIGTDITGTVSLGNTGAGILLSGAAGITVGGSTAAARNIISGNSGNGIVITGSAAAGNVVAGNYIGTNVSGTALGNGSAGILVSGGAANNSIGAASAGMGNTIAFNAGAGVAVVGATTTGNAIRGNSIYGNAHLGIDLGGTGAVVLNDSLGHSGPNNFEDFPTLQVFTPGVPTVVSGNFGGTAGVTITLDFYANTAAEPSGFGQGQIYLGSQVVTTAAGGAFTAPLPGSSLGGQLVTATASDAAGNTSEFSADLAYPAFTDTPPVVAVSGPRAPFAGAPVSLTSTVTGATAGKTYTYAWTVTQPANPAFALPSTVVTNQPNLVFTPLRPGSYVATLTVTDNFGATGTASFTFTAGVPGPGVVIRGAQDSYAAGSAVALTSVVVEPTGATPTSYAWVVTFNGGAYILPAGTVTNAAAFTFTPAANGLYGVSLNVVDSDGGTSGTSVFFVVSGAPPTASILGAPTFGQEGTPIRLGAAGNPGLSGPLTYNWAVFLNGSTTPYVTQNGDTTGFLSFTPNQRGRTRSR
jgi:streptogramin lyase